MCFIPALLFAWRGTYVRLFHDDWIHLAGTREMSVFEAVLWHRNEVGWHGSYSAIVVKTLYNSTLGPQGIKLFPTVTLASLIAAGAILINQVFDQLSPNRSRWRLALMTSTFLGCAAASAFYSWEALFKYSVTVRYLLPLTFTVLLLSLLLHIRQLSDAQTKKRWWTGCAALAFWIAGFNEIYTLGLALGASVLLASVALAGGEWRKRLGYPLFSCWLGVALGGLTMITAPSVAMRASGLYEKTASFWHEFPEMIWSGMLDRFGDPDLQMAFVLMVAVGILVGFALPPPPRKCQESATASGLPAAGCLD